MKDERVARQPGHSATLLHEASAGAIAGFNILVFSLSVSALIFSGDLAVGAAWGGTMMLISSIVATLVLLPGKRHGLVLGAVQIAPIAFLFPAIFAIAARAAERGAPQEGVVQIFMLLGATAVVTGIVMVLTARLDISRILRLTPYAVSSGFLTAAGILLFISSGRLISPTRSLSDIVGGTWVLADLENLLLMTGAIVAMFILARWRKDFGPAVGFGAMIVGFYLLAVLNGTNVEGLRGAGFLPASATAGDLTGNLATFAGVDAALVLDVIPSILGAVMVSILGLMFNMNGIELASRRELSSRSMLQRTGLANIGLGLVGGTVSYPSAVNTVSVLHMGARGHGAAYAVCAVLVAGIAMSREVMPFLPIFATAGLMGYVGLSIAYAWGIAPASRHSRTDMLVIALIVVSTITLSMLTAIGIGIVVACIIFAVIYARIPVIRRTDTLTTRRSTVDRGPQQTAILDRLGEKVLILSVQGYLFFGSAEQLFTRVREALDCDTPPEEIICDLKRVNGLDSAAISTILKLHNIAEGAAMKLVLAEATGEAHRALQSNGLCGRFSDHLDYVETTDAALEQAEERLILTGCDGRSDETALTTLEELLTRPELAPRMLDMMERRELKAGEKLIAFGARDTDVFLIDHGRLAVSAQTATGDSLRVRSLRAGSFVGEIASYAGLARTADVIAETDAVVYCARAEALRQALLSDPELASEWHRIMAINLADKLNRTTLLLRDSA
ncbi:MAG: SLC26A/SulP transporter family protein [Rhodobiaceae bacterium]|nr:SLC26A/SulP transporter family protein [Rhodobiaceae bacterium]